MPAPDSGGAFTASEVITVAIGRWAVASSPTRIRTLLGSCVGVVLYDRIACLGGLAHVVLPQSRGAVDHPGKYADTAIPALLEDMERRLRSKVQGRLAAKLVGGANMFPSGADSSSALNIGRLNQEAVERLLEELRIPIVGRDLGGGNGRQLSLDTTSGMVSIRIPGGADYSI